MPSAKHASQGPPTHVCTSACTAATAASLAPAHSSTRTPPSGSTPTPPPTPVDTHCERHGTPAQPRPQPPWPPPGTLRCTMAHHPPAPRPPRPPRHPRRSLCGKRAGMARADARVWAPVGCTSGSSHSCVAAARPCCPPLPPFKHLHPPPPHKKKKKTDAPSPSPKKRCSSNAYCPLSTRTHARTVCP